MYYYTVYTPYTAQCVNRKSVRGRSVHSFARFLPYFHIPLILLLVYPLWQLDYLAKVGDTRGGWTCIVQYRIFELRDNTLLVTPY